MADDQPTAVRNPARHEGADTFQDVPGTPDMAASEENRGRRAAEVNGAVVGSGAGAGGGGGPEDFDGGPGGGRVTPKPVENHAPASDGRAHGSR